MAVSVNSVIKRGKARFTNDVTSSLRTVAERFKEEVSVMDWATGDGVTDDYAAFLAASDNGVTTTLPAGVYRISTNLTFMPKVRFLHGARVIPEAGVVIRFAGGIDAEETQFIFDLSEGGGVHCHQVLSSAWFGASGRGDTTTTGGITATQNTLVVASAVTFEVGNWIWITGAGTAGANLATMITAVSGTTLTLKDAAVTTVAGAAVLHIDSQALQWFIDANTYPGLSQSTEPLGKCVIRHGLYNLIETLNFGWGDAYHGGTLAGEGVRTYAFNRINGTAIRMLVADRPAIAINSSRFPVIEEMTIHGIMKEYIETNALGTTIPVFNDLTAADWIDPAVLSDYPTLDEVTSPYTAIAIDPYAGTSPTLTSPYPDQPIPIWAPKQTQYGNAGSSKILIRNVQIEGFYIGMVVAPNADGNGDFVQMDHSQIINCVYGVSVGNSQSRLVTLNNCEIDRIHTALVTQVSGVQNGKPSIVLNDCEIGAVIYWYDIDNLNYGGCLTFNHCYGEIIYKLNQSAAPAAGLTPVAFNHCEFSFWWMYHGIPKEFVHSEGPMKFDSCHFSTIINDPATKYPPFYHLDAPASLTVITNCTVNAGIEADSGFSNCDKQVINATGGLTFRNLTTDLPSGFSWINGQGYDLNTFTVGTTIRCKDVVASNRQFGLPVYSKIAQSIHARYDAGVPHASGVNEWDKTALGFSTVGRLVTVTGLPNSVVGGSFGALLGGAVGDLVYDTETKIVFVIISSWTSATTTILMEAKTGYDNPDGVPGDLYQEPTNTGTLYFLNCRKYMPGRVAHYDTTATSTTLANVQQPDTYAGWIDSVDQGMRPNDFIFQVDLVENDFGFTGASKITAVTPGTPSMTMLGAAARTEVHKRLGVCVRAPLANEVLTS